MVTNSVLIFLKNVAWLVRPSAISFTTNMAVELHSLRRIPANVEKILQKCKNTLMGGLEVASHPSIQVVQWLVQWLAVVYYDDVYFIIMQQYYRICLIIFYCSQSPLSTIQH